MKSDFVTIDFETTGLTAASNRVIEVGIVRTSPSGEIVEQFSSLVNPGRDVGRTDIHGISAGLLRTAPRFEEISGEIARLLNGGVLVAHNARFDLRFLAAELGREQREYAELDALCTLELMYAGYPHGPRKLSHCCDFLGIEKGEAHCALDDALMASNLLHHLLDVTVPVHVPREIEISLSPIATRSAVPRTEAIDPRTRESSYLAGLIEKLPDDGAVGITSAVSAAQYLNFLDMALEDRKIEFEEADELAAFARDAGLSSGRVAGLNSAYMANLCAAAVEDGVVTDDERNDLELVAKLLGVSEWEPLLDVVGGRATARIQTGIPVGCSVCFTGSMRIKRDEIESIAQTRGLVVKSSVTKTLDLLVVADADSESTKAKKARDYGVRVIHESVFIRMLDEVGPTG
jgi:DNA polymerase-3 subunit epsilon